ncbi:hypothetical protein, partial [Staphylococcus saprophyticus]|uniref:hypothetical protein n=1 Tax=Staphylococcus saprophyticus TaxID=29385 RepID=UPI00289BD13C
IDIPDEAEAAAYISDILNFKVGGGIHRVARPHFNSISLEYRDSISYPQYRGRPYQAMTIHSGGYSVSLSALRHVPAVRQSAFARRGFLSPHHPHVCCRKRN